MARPVDLARLSADLRSAYQQAWDRIVAEQERIAHEPLRWRRQKRLRELRRNVESLMANVDSQAAGWLANRLDQVYAQGAATTLAEVGSAFEWTLTDRDAVARLASDLMDDLLSATRFVRRDVKRFIREMAQAETASGVAAGDTAEQIARRFQRVVTDRGIRAVRYSDGSLHGLADYADMAIRTKTATAFNEGLLRAGSGVAFFEVFDGFDCGWTSHDDVDKANGTIRSAEECGAQTLSHPRCQRSFGPRPDIATAQEAAVGQPSTTQAQRADQAQSELARRTALDRRAARLDRHARLARNG